MRINKDFRSSMHRNIEEANLEGEELAAGFFRESSDLIIETADIIAECLSDGGKLLTFGNGGSAADAEHFAAELVNRFLVDRKAFAAISLNTAPSVMTSIANDMSYDFIFSRQIEALGRSRDTAFGISTSGNSQNIIEAVSKAGSMGIKTVCLLGNDGGQLKNICDIALVVNSKSTPRIQEVHIRTIHLLCEFIEKMLTGRGL